MHGILLQEEIKSGLMTCQLNTAGSLLKLLKTTAEPLSFTAGRSHIRYDDLLTDYRRDSSPAIRDDYPVSGL